jgi:hypothetical protein
MAGADFLNGVVVVPFLVMALIPFSHLAQEILSQSNSAIFAIAGGIGLIFVVGELSHTQ